ncbi:hypothetical protein DDZ13_06895 [Coraliomargarita sinensis]|uniref:Uncharacterized protein n=1 Tax=Coraliomargarita sinensis TaxID=2174842 RepID=A0A317ZKC0_9BACT|nr:hypothetical protein DDZ13_06895 [Coraliomargarita sinensis]
MSKKSKAERRAIVKELQRKEEEEKPQRWGRNRSLTLINVNERLKVNPCVYEVKHSTMGLHLTRLDYI